MTQTRTLTDLARTAAASCLGLTPHFDEDHLHAAVVALTLDLPGSLAELHALGSTGDPLVDRRLRAAALLTCPVGDVRGRWHRVRLFLESDARVSDHHRFFPEPAPAGVDTNQLALAL